MRRAVIWVREVVEGEGRLSNSMPVTVLLQLPVPVHTLPPVPGACLLSLGNPPLEEKCLGRGEFYRESGRLRKDKPVFPQPQIKYPKLLKGEKSL